MTGKTKGLISFLFLLSLISCGDRPKGVLSEDRMVGLLVDMELAEAYVNTQMSGSASDRIEIGKRVLETHGVTEAELDTTLAWYGRNMDDYAKLFDKVDAEIEKRQKKYTEVPGHTPRESDNLWPYPVHLVISPLSGYESFAFNLPEPKVEKGGVLNLSFHLPNPAPLKGVLGVEYTDGYGESTVSNFTSKSKIEISLQTDTAKDIAKLYGFLLLKDSKSLPLYIDSISLKVEPIDSMAYRSKKRSQKGYGIMRAQKQPEKPEVKLETDSIKATDSTEIKNNVDTLVNDKNEKELSVSKPVKRPRGAHQKDMKQ